MGDHSKWDHMLVVKIAKYRGFCVYRGSYLIWSPVIGNREEKVENTRTVVTHFAMLSIDWSVELTADVFFFVFCIKSKSICSPQARYYILFTSCVDNWYLWTRLHEVTTGSNHFCATAVWRMINVLCLASENRKQPKLLRTELYVLVHPRCVFILPHRITGGVLGKCIVITTYEQIS